MNHIAKCLSCLYILNLLAAPCRAAPAVCTNNCHPFYFGLSGGYGATTWQGLVPSQKNQNVAMSMSTPFNVREGGAVWGLFLGYEFIPNFALEGSYMRFQNANVNFGSDSLFKFDYGASSLITRTESTALMGKILLQIPHTEVRAYSSAGVAVTHRWDYINNLYRVTPTFGFGANYNFTPRVMLELGGSFTAGYGESEIEPVNDYIPFLYAAFLRIAYRV